MKLAKYTTPWGAQVAAYAREGTSDENTLISCLTEDEYQIQELGMTGLAIDLGSHIGGVSLALVAKGFKVYAVEILPENNAVAEKNFTVNGFSSAIKLYPLAVVGKSQDKKVPVYYSDASTESGKVHEFIGTTAKRNLVKERVRSGRKLLVGSIPLSEILQEAGHCDFLKADIEGAEWEVFQHTPKAALNTIDRIAIEIDNQGGKETSTQEFLAILGDDFVDVSAKYFPKWSLPSTLVHGYYINKRIA